MGRSLSYGFRILKLPLSDDGQLLEYDLIISKEILKSLLVIA
jgi:hypothetical protein